MTFNVEKAWGSQSPARPEFRNLSGRTWTKLPFFITSFTTILYFSEINVENSSWYPKIRGWLRNPHQLWKGAEAKKQTAEPLLLSPPALPSLSTLQSLIAQLMKAEHPQYFPICPKRVISSFYQLERLLGFKS